MNIRLLLYIILGSDRFFFFFNSPVHIFLFCIRRSIVVGENGTTEIFAQSTRNEFRAVNGIEEYFGATRES